MNRTIFMKNLKEKEEQTSKEPKKHPLMLNSKKSSLTKIERSGFAMPNH
jgi:hypothetical protein